MGASASAIGAGAIAWLIATQIVASDGARTAKKQPFKGCLGRICPS
jgi:hypothetical protein